MSYTDDRAAIIDVGNRMMWSVDTQDWDSFRSVFADKIAVDFTSFWGGEPQQATPVEIASEWSKLFARFDATQHLLGNHLVAVDGDRGELTAACQATHRRDDKFGSPIWTFGGFYRFGVERVRGEWKINSILMTASWGEGNKDVVLSAAVVLNQS